MFNVNNIYLNTWKNIYYYIYNVILKDQNRLLIHFKSYNTTEFKVNSNFILNHVFCQQVLVSLYLLQDAALKIYHNIK